MSAADIAWVVIAGMALLFIGQYGRQIAREREDQPTKAGMPRVFVRTTDTIGGVSWYLGRAVRHAAVYVGEMFSATFNYVRNMSWWVIGAFGIGGAYIFYILVGIVQFDPVAWLYVAIAIVSSLEVVDMGLFSDPKMVFAALGGLFLVVFTIKWMISEGMSEPEDD